MLNLTIQDIARRVNLGTNTVGAVLAGKASGKKAWPVVNALGLNWMQIHNLDLPESDFHLAVNGNGHEFVHRGEVEAGP